MIVAPLSERTIEEALRAGGALLDVARRERVPAFAASQIEGPAVLLGQHQRAPRVLDPSRCRAGGVTVYRRATSGTAAFIGRRALLFSLALPHVAALHPDASPRTLLNRNVRPLLRGLSAAGALAHYFGREWVSVRKRPAMLLAFDVGEDGAVLVEAIAGIDEPFALPPALASEDERALARLTGHEPLALAEVLPAGATPGGVAHRIADAVAARASSSVIALADLPPARDETPARPFAIEPDAADLPPPGARLLAPVRIPIGWLERAVMPGTALPSWLGGDVLAPRFALDRIAHLASAAASRAGPEDTAIRAPVPTDDLDLLPVDGVTAREIFGSLSDLGLTE